MVLGRPCPAQRFIFKLSVFSCLLFFVERCNKECFHPNQQNEGSHEERAEPDVGTGHHQEHGLTDFGLSVPVTKQVSVQTCGFIPPKNVDRQTLWKADESVNKMKAAKRICSFSCIALLREVYSLGNRVAVVGSSWLCDRHQ